MTFDSSIITNSPKWLARPGWHYINYLFESYPCTPNSSTFSICNVYYGFNTLFRLQWAFLSGNIYALVFYLSYRFILGADTTLPPSSGIYKLLYGMIAPMTSQQTSIAFFFTLFFQQVFQQHAEKGGAGKA